MALKSSKSVEEYLPFELSEIPDHLIHRARTELFEDEETRIHSLKLLRSMLKDEPNLHWQDDDLFLLSFLRARKFDVKKALHLVKNTYTQRERHDEIYNNFNFQDVQKVLDANIFGFLPHRNKDGSAIFLIRVSHWHPPEITLGEVMRGFTCALFHAILSPATQIAGFTVLFNFAGLSLGHVPHISLSYVRLLIEALQNCFPARFRAIYAVNENPVFASFWIIIKHFLKKKIRERIHFCGKNIKKIHKYISPSILPADFQGELPPYDNTEWKKLVEEEADYLQRVFVYGYTKKKSKF